MKLMTCDIIAGCYGGACGVIVGYPLDTIKTLQQKTNSRLLPTITSIYQRNRGLKCFAGFYRGMFFPCITNGGLNSVIFAMYGVQLRFMQKPFRDDEKKILWERHVFVAGSCAGFIQSFLACPIEVIKIRLQTLTYIGGPLKCAKDLIKKHGLLGLYRGITPMCFRDVFPYGIYMLVYDRMLNIEADVLDSQRKFIGGSGYGKINSHLEMTLTALAGATAGVLSWLFVVPFDVAKTVMQADFRYKSMYQCMYEIVKKNGWQALFRGSFIVVARAIPVNAATFLGYEYCLDKCYSSFPIDDPVPKNNFHF